MYSTQPSLSTYCTLEPLMIVVNYFSKSEILLIGDSTVRTAGKGGGGEGDGGK